MKAGRINSIILLSIVCLAAVLVIQGLWLQQAWTGNRRHFDQAVNDALNETVAGLEKKVVHKVFNQQFQTDSATTVELNFGGIETGPGIHIIRRDSVLQTQDNDTLKLVHNDVRSYTFAGDSAAKHSITDRLDNIVVNILSDLESAKLPLIAIINPGGIDTLLQDALKQRGIGGSYSYAIKSIGGISFQADGFDTAQKTGLYSVKLYPLHAAMRPDELLLQVHNLDNRVLHSLWPFALASLVFTLVIILTFGISIRTILKQKKLGDIKNDFINNMTHEFKTPIATISIAADALKERAITPEQTLKFAGVIKEESRHMNQKVETILQMALMEQHQAKLALQTADIHALLKQALKHMQLQLEKSGATVIENYNATEGDVLADAQHLTGVFANIIDNAIKYSAGGVHITITTANKNNLLEIIFTDKGIGMTREEQKHMFDKFYRAHRGNIHNVKGFGLGLSYAREIITRHGGVIKVESQKNEGTSLIISLPLV